MPDLRHWLATALVAPIFPLLLVQGRHVRRVTPRLPGATGPASGTVGLGPSPLRLLVVGESTVAGVGASTHDTALTGQIAVALHEQLGRTIEWHAVGLNGVTAERTRLELVPLIPEESFDVVAIVLGVNDVLSLHGPRRWSRDLVSLVSSIRDRVGPATILLAEVPPMEKFPAFPQPLRGMLGARAAALGRASAHLCRQLEDVWCCRGSVEEDPRFFCEDRFHPSEAGYRAWGEAMAREIADVVGGPPD